MDCSGHWHQCIHSLQSLPTRPSGMKASRSHWHRPGKRWPAKIVSPRDLKFSTRGTHFDIPMNHALHYLGIRFLIGVDLNVGHENAGLRKIFQPFPNDRFRQIESVARSAIHRCDLPLVLLPRECASKIPVLIKCGVNAIVVAFVQNLYALGLQTFYSTNFIPVRSLRYVLQCLYFDVPSRLRIPGIAMP